MKLKAFSWNYFHLIFGMDYMDLRSTIESYSFHGLRSMVSKTNLYLFFALPFPLFRHPSLSSSQFPAVLYLTFKLPSETFLKFVTWIKIQFNFSVYLKFVISLYLIHIIAFINGEFYGTVAFVSLVEWPKVEFFGNTFFRVCKMVCINTICSIRLESGEHGIQVLAIRELKANNFLKWR